MSDRTRLKVKAERLTLGDIFELIFGAIALTFWVAFYLCCFLFPVVVVASLIKYLFS